MSVIVPTRNRPRALAACLASLAELDYPRPRYEVLVVDDGGEIPAAQAVCAEHERLDLKVVVRLPGGPAAARNCGAASARGDMLAFIDDDCVADRGWLRALASALRARPGSMVGGCTVNALTGNPFSSASQAVLDFVYSYFNADPASARFFGAANFAIPAAAFREMGGFDERFWTSEDRDLCDRWLERGGSMAFAPEAVVRHRHALTLGSFLAQHFAYGRGAYQLRHDRGRREQAPLQLEPPSFYLQLLTSPLRDPSRARGLLLTVLVGLSQVASAAGFAWEMLWPSPGNAPHR